MELITSLNDNDEITINLFGKEESVMVFSTGDNRYDEDGDDKEDGISMHRMMTAMR